MSRPLLVDQIKSGSILANLTNDMFVVASTQVIDDGNIFSVWNSNNLEFAVTNNNQAVISILSGYTNYEDITLMVNTPNAADDHRLLFTYGMNAGNLLGMIQAYNNEFTVSAGSNHEIILITANGGAPKDISLILGTDTASPYTSFANINMVLGDDSGSSLVSFQNSAESEVGWINSLGYASFSRYTTDTDIVMQLGDNEGGNKISILNNNGDEVAWIDSTGKASFSEFVTPLAGTTSLAVSDDNNKTVTIPDQGTTDYSVSLTMRNATANDPFILVRVTSQTATEFTVRFSSTIPNSNYNLDWIIVKH